MRTIKATPIILLVTFLLLVIIEMFARVAYTVKDQSHEMEGISWYALSADLGWTRRPGFAGASPDIGGKYNAFDEQGYFSVDSQQVRRGTQPRVLFLGDSNTFGYGVPNDKSFVEIVDQLLPEIDAINLGVVGHTSYQGMHMLFEEAPKLKPQIAVVSFNFNDRRGVSPDRVDGDLHFQSLVRGQQTSGHLNVLEYSYTFRALRSLVKPERAISELPSLDTIVPRVGPDAYRDNLVRIVRFARENDIEPVFLLLKDNPIQTAYIRRGIELAEAGDYGGARAQLVRALRERTWFRHLARIRLAETYTLAGDEEEAKKSLVPQAFPSYYFGAFPIKMDTDYNLIMQEVAAEYGVAVADPRQELDDNPMDYLDFCHPNVNGHERVAEVLVPVLRAALAGQVDRERRVN